MKNEDLTLPYDFGSNGKLHINNEFNNELQIKRLSELYHSFLTGYGKGVNEI